MKHRRLTAASFAVGIVTSLAGPLPARGGDVPFTEHVISTAADYAVSVFATDLDGDGDTDVLSASSSDNKIAWYENDGGSPPTFTEHLISNSALSASSVFATDVDGDGNTDVLSASFWDDKIAWYENDGGSPPSFTERVISTTADFAVSVFAIDVDGDGDTDVLSASQFDDKIAWYESDGGRPPSFTERVISTAAMGAFSVFATDLDGDGDIDVLAASFNKVAWHDSDGGSPPSFTERVISTTVSSDGDVFAIDIDGDGDIDVLSAANASRQIAWYENDGGSPPSFTERLISIYINRPLSVFATDLDGDGDIDLLSTSRVEDTILWHENDGGLLPSFTERMISTAARSPRSVFATDLDGDGDPDVLSTSSIDDKIMWYENTTAPISCGDGAVEGPEECDDYNAADGDGCSSVCTVESGFVCTGQPSVCRPDCNGNGIRDDDDIATGTSSDCNDNIIPDECDIAAGTSLDDFPPRRSPDGIPDECQTRTPLRIDLSHGRAGRRPTKRPR